MDHTITLKSLPLRGLSVQDFIVWKESVVKQLEQNIDHELFLPGGLYCIWTALKDCVDGQRILELHSQDPARIKLEVVKNETSHCKLLLEDLLIGRNNQLDEFIEMVCDLTSNLNEDTVKQCCTSFQNIIDIVVENYEFTEKPENIFSLSHVQLIANEDYSDFYKRLRSDICDKFKGKGMKSNEEELLEDECMSPTFEDVIILWCLEKIDRRLPYLANQIYGEKLVGDVTLKDLQEEIFINIQNLLGSDKLDKAEETEIEQVEVDPKVEDYDDIKHFDYVKNRDEEYLSDVKYDVDDPEISEDIYIKDIENSITCGDCNKVFSNKKKLWDHARSHRLEPSICEFCEKQFRCKKALIDHISKRHKITFKCTLCEEHIVGQAKYEKHLKDNHAEEYKIFCNKKNNSTGYLCRYCQESLDSQQELRKHILKHKELNEISYVETGIKKPGPVPKLPEDKNKEVVCDTCGKHVKIKSMKQHRKQHLDEMYCKICDSTFTLRKEYLTHMRSHKSQESHLKLAACDKCGQTFSQTNFLRKHMKIHENGGEKLKCKTCKRTFYDNDEMSAHVCKHHECDICGIKFLRARNLEFHRKMHFGEAIFSCNQCESSFLNKKRLNEHINYQHKREKKYQCDLCDKKFLMKSGLAQHTLTHTGEKPFKCVDCGQRFTQRGNLDTHMKLHRNEMPYECAGCSSKFRQVGDLKRHRELKKCGFSQRDYYGQEEQNIIKLFHTDEIAINRKIDSQKQ